MSLLSVFFCFMEYTCITYFAYLGMLNYPFKMRQYLEKFYFRRLCLLTANLGYKTNTSPKKKLSKYFKFDTSHKSDVARTFFHLSSFKTEICVKQKLASNLLRAISQTFLKYHTDL